MLMRENAGIFCGLVFAVFMLLFAATFITNSAAGEEAKTESGVLPAFSGAEGAAKFNFLGMAK